MEGELYSEVVRNFGPLHTYLSSRNKKLLQKLVPDTTMVMRMWGKGKSSPFGK
jgi:hypothetical protein